MAWLTGIRRKPLDATYNDRDRSRELEIFHSLFRSPGLPAAASPEPGFYERVRSRIDELKQQSIWSPFVYSPFRTWLAIIWFFLPLALLVYVFAAELRAEKIWRPATAATSTVILGANNIEQQRDAVLLEFATYKRSD